MAQPVREFSTTKLVVPNDIWIDGQQRRWQVLQVTPDQECDPRWPKVAFTAVPLIPKEMH